jgi:hypothetical protein
LSTAPGVSKPNRNIAQAVQNTLGLCRFLFDLVRNQVQKESKESQVEQPQEVPAHQSKQAEQAEKRKQRKPTSLFHCQILQTIFVEPDTKSIILESGATPASMHTGESVLQPNVEIEGVLN